MFLLTVVAPPKDKPAPTAAAVGQRGTSTTSSTNRSNNNNNNNNKRTSTIGVGVGNPSSPTKTREQQRQEAAAPTTRSGTTRMGVGTKSKTLRHHNGNNNNNKIRHEDAMTLSKTKTAATAAAGGVSSKTTSFQVDSTQRPHHHHHSNLNTNTNNRGRQLPLTAASLAASSRGVVAVLEHQYQAIHPTRRSDRHVSSDRLARTSKGHHRGQESKSISTSTMTSVREKDQEDEQKSSLAIGTQQEVNQTLDFMYAQQSQSPPPKSLVESADLWKRAVWTLVQTPEFRAFLHQSRHVLLAVGEVVVHTAFLPITLPFFVARTTTEWILGGSKTVVCALRHVLIKSITTTATVKAIKDDDDHRHNEMQLLLLNSEDDDESTSSNNGEWETLTEEQLTKKVVPKDGEKQTHQGDDHRTQEQQQQPPPWIAAVVDGVGNFSNVIMGIAEKIKDDWEAALAPPPVGKPKESTNNNKHNSTNMDRELELEEHSGLKSVKEPEARCVAEVKCEQLMQEERVIEDPSVEKRACDVTEDDEDDDEEEPEDFLARLRLDYVPKVRKNRRTGSCPTACNPAEAATQATCSAEFSKHLVRVDDLGLYTVRINNDNEQQQQKQVLVRYVDLANDCGDAEIRVQAMDRLVRVGLSLLSNNPYACMASDYKLHPPQFDIEWKPENSTSRVLHKLSSLASGDERVQLMLQELLIWSGNCRLQEQSKEQRSNKSPFFLARGYVRKSPLEFMHLLWDNSRTREYNNFCLGRTNQLILQDKILTDGTTTGTKVVRSETRVPFTKLSVMVTCLMHVRPLPKPDNGFIIVSRSTQPGAAGVHTSEDHNKKFLEQANSNEIHWGVNILRSVPNEENVTDLTSISQCGSSLVPQFLAGKIGLLGVKDFFENVRRSKPPTTTTQE